MAVLAHKTDNRLAGQLHMIIEARLSWIESFSETLSKVQKERSE